MKAIWHLAVHDLRVLITEKAAVIVRLIVPVGFIFVIGIANGAFESTPEPPLLAIIDNDKSELSSFLAGQIRAEARGYSICGNDTDAAPGDSSACAQSDDVVELLDSGEIDSAIVIPNGLSGSLRSGGRATLELLQAESNPQEESRLIYMIEAVAARVTTVVMASEGAAAVAVATHAVASNAEAATAAIAMFGSRRVVLESETVDLPDQYVLEGFRQSVPGMGSMFVMLSVLAGATTFIEERKRWTLQRTSIAPVAKWVLLSGKVVGRFFVGIVQFVIAIATGVLIGQIFDIDFGSSPLKLAATMAAFVFCVSALAILLATLVTRDQQASGLTTLIAVTLAPIGGAWWTLDNEFIPSFMRTIAVVSPFYWVMQGFRAAINDLEWGMVLPPVLVLLLVGVVFLAIGTARFSTASRSSP